MKAMTTEAKTSLIGALIALTASLDGLCTDQDPEELSNTLRIAFKEPELYNMYISLLVVDEERAKALLGVFDKALTAPEYDVKIFKKFRQLCGRAGLVPASHTIPESFIQTTEYPVASGAFGDVWEGIYNDKRVAIKALRVYKHDHVKKVRKVFCKEVAMWKRISHPNIVPFLGVCEAPAPLSMVSEWMSNGNVRNYVVKNPDSGRLQLLLDISRGLAFLHSLEIVHGCLKGDNVLVDKSGCARLNDFGFTGIASLNCTEISATEFKGSHRWMAPEFIKTEHEEKSGLPTNASDVFAFGMVTFEIFTGLVPFPEFKTSAVVMKKIIAGERPQKPPKGKKFGLSDELWEIVQSSLVHKAEERPLVGKFVEFLEKATPDMALLRELTEFDVNSEDDIQKLRKMFEEYGDNTLSWMREEETLIVIEVFDRVLNSSLNDSKLRSRCLRGLQKVSARCGLLPKSYWIPHTSLAVPDGAFSAAGRVSSTRQRSIDGHLVAVKTIDPECIDNFSAFKHRLCTSAVIWKRLRHPNVANFLGFDSNYPPFSLVYPWIPNGNLSDYLRDHPGVNKLDLLLNVAQGLSYLHLYNVVHGNLTGYNVLVDGGGYARISDYGLEVVLRGGVSSKSTPTNVRWTAPEVLGTDGGRVPSGDAGKAVDVYSFGMVMFEILTGTAPFQNKSDEEIAIKVPTGLRPGWPSGNPPQGLTGALWEHINACWNQVPKERPTISKLVETLSILGETYHIRDFLHLPRHPTEVSAKREQAEKPRPGAEEPKPGIEEPKPGIEEPKPTVPQTSNLSAPANRNPPACIQLISHAFSSHEVISLVEAIFTSKEEIKMIRDLRGEAAQTLIDVVHKALDLPDFPPQFRRKCLSALCWICGRQALLPRSLQIPLCYNRSGAPLYHGGFADVWKGEHQGRHVAVKVLRVYSTSDFGKVTSRFCKEVVMWMTLRHPNVLPLLGVTMDDHYFAMASEWMTNGNINEFVKTRRDTNRFELLKDVARGLIYMHGQGMIHGDLKGANILIDQNFHACLADFGLLTTISDPANSTASTSFAVGGTIKWMSPELLDPDQFGFKDSKPTKQSDCYALGMVIYEVLGGRAPFAQFKDFIVIRKVTEGKRLGRPVGPEGAWFTDDLWQMLNLCWETKPENRPDAEAIMVHLEQVSRTWKPPPPQAYEGVEMGGDGGDLTTDSLHRILDCL